MTNLVTILRESRGLTRGALAAATGAAYETIRSYESGTAPTVKWVLRAVDALELTDDERAALLAWAQQLVVAREQARR